MGSKNEPVDLTDDSVLSPVTLGKRKATGAAAPRPSKRVRAMKENQVSDVISSPSRKKAGEKQGEEKRLRRFRPKPPASFAEVFHRASTQRFYVLRRERCGSEECPEEVFDLTGSTGNIYTVHICRIPTCNCPHARKGNQCKHIIFVSRTIPE
jgi:hypothetical protein